MLLPPWLLWFFRSGNSINFEFRNMNVIDCEFGGVYILTAVSIADFSFWSVGLRPFRIFSASFKFMLNEGMSESCDSDACLVDIIGFRLRMQWGYDIWRDVENDDDGGVVGGFGESWMVKEEDRWNKCGETWTVYRLRIIKEDFTVLWAASNGCWFEFGMLILWRDCGRRKYYGTVNRGRWGDDTRWKCEVKI